ncbi:MAG: hypothetical protein QXU98_00855 [Candidatus Parvarchaeota archaeon]
MRLDYNIAVGTSWSGLIDIDKTLNDTEIRRTFAHLGDVSNGRLSWDKFNLMWVKLIVKKHISPDDGSEFWIERANSRGIKKRDIDDAKSLDEIVRILGDADYGKLAEEGGYERFYKPRDISISDLYRSDSSGTTGAPKTVYHGISPLVFSALDELVGILDRVPYERLTNKKLLCLGPGGAYQREHKELADILDMEYVDLSFSTKGLKNKSNEEVERIIGPVMKKTSEYLAEGNVGMMTGTPQVVYSLPKKFIENIDLIKLSGVGINAGEIKKLEDEFGRKGTKFLPMYGHFAGKSSIGKVNGDSIEYFPPYPFTIYSFDEAIGYGQSGRSRLIVAQPELLLIHPEDYGKKVKSDELFKGVDGLADPSR